jgi:mRNA interferase RelE/StbE
MAYVVEFSPAARRQLRKLDPPILKRILRRIEKLEKQPRPKSAKKLQGSGEPLYRVRESDYRIVYSIEDDRLIVLVVRIGHRGEVYR